LKKKQKIDFKKMEENKNSVFISVIVPIYNMGKYLNRCLASLEVQTYDNFEIILVDDGSTDNSLNICKEFKKNVPRLPITIIHKENRGLSSARNAGIESARGQYVIFPDPDDWVDPDYLETIGQMRRKYPDSLCICGHYVEDTSGCYRSTSGIEKQLTKEEAINVLFDSDGYCGFACNKLYDLAIIKKHNLQFDIQLGTVQDLHFAFRYFLKSDSFVYNPKPLYHYFQHAGGVTSMRLTPRKISGVLTYNKIIEVAEREYPAIIKTAKATKANFCVTLLESAHKSSVEKPLLKTLKREVWENYRYLLTSKRYSLSRKLFCLLALIFRPACLHQIRRLKNLNSEEDNDNF